MPTIRHESLLMLSRNRSTLAAHSLNSVLDVTLPEHIVPRTDSADLTNIQPAEYRADHVLCLIGPDGEIVRGVIIEVQLSIDEHKRFSWPAYVMNLRARLKCPVSLLIVTLDETVARWAAQPIDLDGAGNFYTPKVMGPAQIPEVTDLAEAIADPEGAVLSVMVHGRSSDVRKAVQIARVALQACAELERDRSIIYCDLISTSLSEEALKEIRTMKASEYEFQSDFAKGYLAQGEMQGRAKLIARQLTLRFGKLSGDERGKISKASISELDLIGERLLTSATLQEALADA